MPVPVFGILLPRNLGLLRDKQTLRESAPPTFGWTARLTSADAFNNRSSVGGRRGMKHDREAKYQRGCGWKLISPQAASCMLTGTALECRGAAATASALYKGR